MAKWPNTHIRKCPHLAIWLFGNFGLVVIWAFGHSLGLLGVFWGNWAFGLLGMWLLGRLDTWSFGHLGIWAFEHSFGHLSIWVCGYLGVWAF